MEQWNNSDNSNSTDIGFSLDYQIALVTMYSVVLVGGIVSIALMINILKSNIRSVTTMAVLNLIVVHLLFLLTVPFRIYFFATGRWKLTWTFCKVVSGMIHAHMYITFIFYVVILVIRYLSFFSGRNQIEFHRKVHALFASLTVWAIVLILVLPVFAVTYGATEEASVSTCFSFGGELENIAVATLNYLIIAVIVLITLLLACCQVWILCRVLRKYGAVYYQHQEFWAQMKSLSFVLVMFVCFVPYHLFRVYYLSHYNSLQKENEVFLGVTAFSCLDMLTFLGRNACGSCNVGCCLK